MIAETPLAALRPHMKTAKSIEVARLALAGQPGGITVSTLAEAEYFVGHGLFDQLYAVAGLLASQPRWERNGSRASSGS